VLDDGVIQEQAPARFATVLQPKAYGAFNLHLATHELTLDFFVLYSSVASTLGSAGQSNYAAASAFLDSLAPYRRASGLPAVSINWGPWAEVGMAARLAQPADRRRVLGVEPIGDSLGRWALDCVLTGGPAMVLVQQVNWELLTQQTAYLPRPMLAGLVGRPVTRPSPLAARL